MKNATLLLICLTISSQTFAQEPTRQKEVGMIFQDFDNFGLTYRTGTSAAMWRFNTLFINGRDSEINGDQFDQENSFFGFNLQGGREWRKPILADFEFRYGVDISFGYDQSTRVSEITSGNMEKIETESTRLSPGINFVLGVNYVLKDKLVFGLEILPGITYTSGEETSIRTTVDGRTETASDNNSLRYGFSNNSAQLSIAYRFAKIN